MALLPIARRLVGEYYDSFSNLDKQLIGQTGRIVLAGLPSVIVALIPGALQRLASISPGIEVKVLGMPEQSVIAAVRDGSADFGIVTQPAAADWFEFHQMINDEYVLVCPLNHPVARKKQVDWSILSQYPFIGLTSASSVRPLIERVFVSLNLKIDIRYEADHLSLVGAMVASGLGLTVLPKLALALINCSELVSIHLGDPVVERVIGTILRTDLALSPAARRLDSALADEISDKYHPNALYPQS